MLKKLAELTVRRETTKKLFYKKYPYKAVFMFPMQQWGGRYGNTFRRIDGQCMEMINSLPKTYKRRIEMGSASIFSLTKEEHDQVCKLLGVWLSSTTEPDNETQLEFLLAQTGKKILCNKLPFDKYQYKIYLKDLTYEKRVNLKDWLSKYGDKVRMTESSWRWINGIQRWVWKPFFYAVDQNMMSMVCLYLGDSIESFEEFITNSSINTQTGPELCQH